MQSNQTVDILFLIQLSLLIKSKLQVLKYINSFKKLEFEILDLIVNINI